MKRERRVAKVLMTYVLLEHVLHGLVSPARSSLPHDAKVIDVGANWEDRNLQQFWVVLESESFALVPEGSVIPVISVTHTRATLDEIVKERMVV